MKILLTKEAAAVLRISADYCRELIRTGKIRAYKEGRRGGFRIEESEIDRYIENKLNKEYKIGDCRDANLVCDIFGSITMFAWQVENLGNNFIYGNIKVKYNKKKDIHSFYKI